MSHTNYIKSLIVLLTTLILTTLVSVSSQANTTCTTNALGDRTCTTTSAGTTTGNILTNSTFGTGNTTTTTDWSTTGTEVHTHGNFGFTYPSGADTSGGVLAFEGDPTDNVFQDSTLVADGHLTKDQINEGFTSTMSADVWFWNSLKNTFTMKQTITDTQGNTTTQIRTIVDHDPTRNFNGGSFSNETNVYTHGANTQNDFTIRTEMYNDTDGTTYDHYHRGPDVDNVQLSITTAGTQSVVITPCAQLGTCTSIGEDITEAVDLTTDDGIDLFQDIDTKVEEAIQDFGDSAFTTPFVLDTEIAILIEDDLGEVEFMPLEIYIEESFDTFLQDNNLVDTFQQELVFEEITEEEFYEELTSVVGNEFESLMAPDTMIENEPMYFEPDMELMPLPMDPRMETDMDFMPEYPTDGDVYLTDEEMNTFIEENPDMIEYADENVVMLKPPSEFENYDDTVMPGPPSEETMIEEPEMIEEEFTDGPPRGPNVTEPKEEEITNEPEIAREEVKEETPTETNTETETNADATTTTKTEDTDTETMETNETREADSEKSTMAENTETERSETETDTKETMDDKTISNDTKTAIKDRSISIKVKRIIAKLEKTLKDVSDQVKAVQFVTLKGIQNQGANLSSYSNVQLQDTIKLNDGNLDFFKQINIQQEQIYANSNLNAYSNNDPISIKQTELKKIDIEKQRLIYEIQKLKKG